MNFNFVSKNNIGVFATLLFVILLSQSRLFDFLIDTFLGRIILIIFILGISYTNKFLGIFAVLFIIIMFNQSSLGYTEGFTNDDSQNTNNQENINKQEIKNNITQNPSTTSSNNSLQQTPTTQKSKSTEGQEGFNMIDREGTILKGKPSNEVPVFPNVNNDNNSVEAFDNSVFKGGYTRI
jgi:hypothetical protein